MIPSTKDQPNPDESLDAMLNGAKWPDPTPQATRMLAVHYRSLVKRQQVWRFVGASLAMAAAVGIVVTAVFLPTETRTDRPVVAVVTQTEPSKPSLPLADLSVGRAPTPWEAFLVQPQKQPKPVFLDEAVVMTDFAVEVLGDNRRSDAATFATELIKSMELTTVETRLLQRVKLDRGERQLAAVRLLADVGSPRVVPMLEKLAKSPGLRAAVLPGLIRMANVDTLKLLIAGETDVICRRRLIAAILDHDSSVAVPVYLDYVMDTQTSSDAIEALEYVKAPPMAALLASMGANRMEVRYAAAKVYGRVADRFALSRLVPMIDQADRRREALVALMASSDPMAQGMIWRVEQNPMLASVMNAVKNELKLKPC